MQRGVIISYSFSIIENNIAKIFEPSAPVPEQRLNSLRETLRQGFLTGVSLMPLISYVSDTMEQLLRTFSRFQELQVDYVLPATITLFGEESFHSKSLMFNAVQKHYPALMEKYQRFFDNSAEMSVYYRNAFAQKMNALCMEYGLENSIYKAALRKL